MFGQLSTFTRTVPLRSQPLCVLLSLPCPFSHGRLAPTQVYTRIEDTVETLVLLVLDPVLKGRGMAGWLHVRVGSCHIYKKMRTMTQSCSLWLFFFILLFGGMDFWGHLKYASRQEKTHVFYHSTDKLIS